jgi:hypothetical protein
MRGFPMPELGYKDMPDTKRLGTWLNNFRQRDVVPTGEVLRRKLAAILLSGGVAPESDPAAIKEENELAAIETAATIAYLSVMRGFTVPLRGYKDMPDTKRLGAWLHNFRQRSVVPTDEVLRRKLAAILLSGGVAPEARRRGAAVVV